MSTFAAQYQGWCSGCNTKIRVGDEVEYNRRHRLVHVGCDVPAVGDDPFDPPGDVRRSPEAIIRGRRNHQRRCADCHLVHAGECW